MCSWETSLSINCSKVSDIMIRCNKSRQWIRFWINSLSIKCHVTLIIPFVPLATRSISSSSIIRLSGSSKSDWFDRLETAKRIKTIPNGSRATWARLAQFARYYTAAGACWIDLFHGRDHDDLRAYLCTGWKEKFVAFRGQNSFFFYIAFYSFPRNHRSQPNSSFNISWVLTATLCFWTRGCPFQISY